ncbi:Vng6431h (plasmid) [Halobacterium salinarum NRC-1]|uniref:Vng6431h n=2 Tax=Halobacterium salinarum NRC-34001 TaxID=2886895 RepID=Q9HHF3_HALSA|nr:Vng6431h [Halobacterium salinarum NRC-1]CAP15266.1 uncharacterized protein OE_6116R [Halobacterium salinarum R1]DAC80003.1 TPA_inf: uncharacterized protein VNG_6431H [Halobacterium salinarum NRC-1]
MTHLFSREVPVFSVVVGSGDLVSSVYRTWDTPIFLSDGERTDVENQQPTRSSAVSRRSVRPQGTSGSDTESEGRRE